MSIFRKARDIFLEKLLSKNETGWVKHMKKVCVLEFLFWAVTIEVWRWIFIKFDNFSRVNERVRCTRTLSKRYTILSRYESFFCRSKKIPFSRRKMHVYFCTAPRFQCTASTHRNRSTYAEIPARKQYSFERKTNFIDRKKFWAQSVQRFSRKNHRNSLKNR